MRAKLWFSTILALALAVPAGGEQHREVEVDRPGSYTRHTLHIPGILRDGSNITLYLGVQDGQIRQAWALLNKFGKLDHRMDWEELKIKGDHLTGRVDITFQYPGEKRYWLAEVTLDAKLKDSTWTGTFSSRIAERGPLKIASKELILKPSDLSWTLIGGQELTAAVSGTVRPLARTQGTVLAEMETRRIVYVLQHVDRWGRGKVKLTFRDGKLQAAAVACRKHDKFQAKVVSSKLEFTDEKLTGTIDIDVTGKAVKQGRYVLKLDATLSGNTVSGTADSFMDGKRVNHERSLLGTVTPKDAKAKADTQVLTFAMPKAVAGRTTPTLELVRRGDKIVSGHVRGYLSTLGKADVGKLQISGGRITGPVELEFPLGSALVRDKTLRETYDLDLKIADDSVTGSYAGTWGQVEETSGALRGVAVGQARLRKAEAIDSKYDWPCFAGPNPSLVANSSGNALIDSLRDARLVWASERTYPGRCQVDRYGESNIRRFKERGFASGGSTPILYDGKVYLFYVQPAKSPPNPKVIKEYAEKGIQTLPLLWATKNDDVVLCLDAATGQTLWKTVLPRVDGYRMGTAGSTKRGPYTAWLCAGEGKVFGVGSDNRMRAFDADNGKVLWVQGHGYCEVPRITNGKVIASAGSDLLARDAKDGKELWRIEDAGSGTATPLEWKHQGKTYLIANNRDGEVRCIDPKDGKVLWTLSGLAGRKHENDTTMSLGGDVLLTEVQVDIARKGGKLLDLPDPAVHDKDDLGRVMVAWRLSPEGAKRIWGLNDRYQPKRSAPPYRDGLFYYRNVRTKHIYAIEADTGKVVSKAPANSNGTVQLMGDRIIILADPSHSQMDLDYYRLDGRKIIPAGARWSVMNAPTTGYWPIVGPRVLADGRMIVRGAQGVYCYDLRAQD